METMYYIGLDVLNWRCNPPADSQLIRLLLR